MLRFRSASVVASSLALAACGSTGHGAGAPDRDAGGGPNTGGAGLAGVGGANTNGGANASGGANTNGGANASGGANANGGADTNGGANTNGGSGAGGGSAAPDASGSGDAGSGGRWVLGYWAVWQANGDPLDHVKWSDMTHAAIAFVLPRAPIATTSDSPFATLDTSNVFSNLGSTGMQDFSGAAHRTRTKALISLGGGGAGAGFAAAAAGANRSAFVADVVAACKEWNYDGVDLDWEDSIDYTDFQSFVHDLRAAAPPGFVITAPIGAVNNNLGIDPGASGLWSAEYAEVDQLNVMTYTGTGAYPGWVVWYFSPLLGSGSDHPFDIASTMAAWHAVGIPKSKLGLGAGFYGRSVGPPVTKVLEDYGSAQVYENDDTLSYGSIRRYFEGQGGAVAQWDDSAKAAWLTWPSSFQPSWSGEFPGDAPPSVQFLTYEDPQGIAAKGAWAKDNGYGGVIIWTINEGIEFPDGSDGYQNPLLDDVAHAFL